MLSMLKTRVKMNKLNKERKTSTNNSLNIIYITSGNLNDEGSKIKIYSYERFFKKPILEMYIFTSMLV